MRHVLLYKGKHIKRGNVFDLSEHGLKFNIQIGINAERYRYYYLSLH
jgi:hypothetical protein